MALELTLHRQRVPMVDAATLEDRTRPALDGSIESRLWYFSWPQWYRYYSEAASAHDPRPTQARLARR